MSDPIPADRGSLPSAAGLDEPRPADTIRFRESRMAMGRACAGGASRAGVAPADLADQLMSERALGRREARDAPACRAQVVAIGVKNGIGQLRTV